MRLLLVALPALLFAQAPKPTPQAPPKPAVSKPAAPNAAAPKPATAPASTTDDQKTIYTLGMYMYQTLATFDLSPAELELVKKGLTDAAGKPPIDISTWGPKFNALAQARGVAVAERQKASGTAYQGMAAAQPGAVKTDSGLIYRELRAGTGASPAPTDTVKVNYKGTLINGTEFDSSYRRNEPAQFALNGVIKCWTEGLQKMKVGGKAVLTCPPDIAYGDRGHPPVIPGGATLTFEVELLEIAAPKP